MVQRGKVDEKPLSLLSVDQVFSQNSNRLQQPSFAPLPFSLNAVQSGEGFGMRHFLYFLHMVCMAVVQGASSSQTNRTLQREL